MKLEKLNEASKAAADYERAQKDLAFLKSSRFFSRPHFAPTTTVGSQDVYEDQGSFSGQLATDLKAALQRYYEGHLQIAEENLRSLGIDVPARV